MATFCRAIWARRSRRISSSLLPLYMGPTTTSIQPVGCGRGSCMAPGLYRPPRRRSIPAGGRLGEGATRQRRVPERAPGALAADLVVHVQGAPVEETVGRAALDRAVAVPPRRREAVALGLSEQVVELALRVDPHAPV